MIGQKQSFHLRSLLCHRAHRSTEAPLLHRPDQTSFILKKFVRINFPHNKFHRNFLWRLLTHKSEKNFIIRSYGEKRNWLTRFFIVLLLFYESCDNLFTDPVHVPTKFCPSAFNKKLFPSNPRHPHSSSPTPPYTFKLTTLPFGSKNPLKPIGRLKSLIKVFNPVKNLVAINPR